MHAAHDLDDVVAVAQPAERAHRPRERDAGEEERRGKPERVRGKEHRALHDRPRVARKHEHRGEHRPDARRGADGKRAAEEEARAAAPRAAEEPGREDPLRHGQRVP